MTRNDPIEWMRTHDASPLADVDSEAPYLREASYDDGITWVDPAPQRAEFAHLASTEATLTGLRSEVSEDGVVTVQARGGWLTRWTPITQ